MTIEQGAQGMMPEPEPFEGEFDLLPSESFPADDLIMEEGHNQTAKVSELDIREAVRRIQAGDNSGMTTIYNEFNNRISRFIGARVPFDTREDLIGGFWLRVVEKLPDTYEDRSLPLGAWLFAIARNIITDYRRHFAVVSMHQLNAAGTEYELNKAEKSTVFPDPYMSQQLSDAISELPPAQRDVIIARFLKDKNIAETAEELDKKTNNIKVLQHKGIANLQTKLADSNPNNY